MKGPGQVGKLEEFEYDEFDVARFWRKVAKAGPDECWNWTACRNKAGYGQFRICGESRAAHRVSLYFSSGVLGLVAAHSCDNAACVNPSHLRWTDTAGNIADAVERARFARGERQRSAKLTSEDVKQIRSLFAAGMAKKALARRFKVYPRSIIDILNGRTWRHVS